MDQKSTITVTEPQVPPLPKSPSKSHLPILLFLLVLSVLVVGAIYVLSARSQITYDSNGSIITPSKTNEKYEVIMQGSYSTIKKRSHFVINDDKAWNDLWYKTSSYIDPIPTPFPIDFTNNTLIAVYQGSKGSGGYSIKVQDVKHLLGNVEIVVEETSPGRGCVVTMAVTSPYQIIKVRKIDVTVRFTVQERIHDCT